MISMMERSSHVERIADSHWKPIITLTDFAILILILWSILILMVLKLPIVDVIMQPTIFRMYQLIIFSFGISAVMYITMIFTINNYQRLNGIYRRNINVAGMQELIFDYIKLNQLRFIIHNDVTEIGMRKMILEEYSYHLVITIDGAFRIILKKLSASNDDLFSGTIEIFPYDNSTEIGVDKLIAFIETNIHGQKYNTSIIQ
jgi:hypothetical protein